MTKTELTDKCRELASTYKNKQMPINEVNWLIENVLKFHPDWDGYFNKKNIVTIIPKKNNPKYGTLCFYLIYSDDSEIDISYVKAIKNIKK